MMGDQEPAERGPAFQAVSMKSEAPLTLILSPLRAGRGELGRTYLGSLFGRRGHGASEGSPLSSQKGEGEGSARLHGYG